MAAMGAILDMGTIRFSTSESLCHCDTYHQVLAQFDLWFGRRCCLKNFKLAAMAAILDTGIERVAT